VQVLPEAGDRAEGTLTPVSENVTTGSERNDESGLASPDGPRLLDGTVVVDLTGEPGAMAARMLADLGAEVVRPVPPGGDPLQSLPHRDAAWTARSVRLSVTGADDPEFAALLARAHIVLDTPAFPGAWSVDPAHAARAVWVSLTPFGLDGPRASWRASDLGIMAASGNLYCTGDPDRAPVRCREPAGYGHSAAEAAFAALTGLASGRPQRVDVSAQEAVAIANMATPARFPDTGFRGARRGANIGRTREIWPTADGFVSFGLRGGKARVPSLETLTRLVDTETLRSMDWSSFSPNTAADETLRAIEADVAAFFARHTMRELYAIACETNLMLAPINSPAEILASEQLAARDFWTVLGDGRRVPATFVTVREGTAARSGRGPAAAPVEGPGAWSGTNIIELGSGAAGPIATRYFVEHGATVLRIESKSRPDFLRVYALGPKNPHGLEGAPMFDGLNPAKRDALFNLKHPKAVELVRRLVVEWADAVAENFAPRAMKSFGLDYDSLVAHKPDLVMVSACLNGQTGPHKDYPGFGGQGSALAGYNFLTGWPDREPVGPHGTITDSLAPRFVATALAAGLLYRRRTGHGVYLDVSQVEAATYSLTPWLLEYQATGVAPGRAGNDDPRASVHGVFPCADVDGVGDRWVAIAAWTESERDRLHTITGGDVGAWTATRAPLAVAEELQAAGIEAVPVQDFGDQHSDPQLAHRHHFVARTHPFMGPGLYERNGLRLSDAEAGYDRSGPTLGQDQDWVLGALLGLDPDEQAALAADGVFD
jgi:crotonobetainyl-CoA:carnitine CoA-transferase CaiB-like acyl-CoA transferase